MKLHHTLLATALATVSAHAASLINDPSFESQTATSSYQRFHTGDNIAGIWFVRQADFDLGLVTSAYTNVLGFPQPPPDGNQYVYLNNGRANGSLFQQIGSLFGTYTFSFSQGNGVAVNSIPGKVNIQFAPIVSGTGINTVFGSAVYDRTFSVLPDGWTIQSDNVTIPVNGNYGIILTAVSGNEALVDNFSLTVPEPSTMLFGVLGIFGLGLRRFRK